MIEGMGQRGVHARMGQIMSRGDLVHALAEPFLPNSEMEKAHAKTQRIGWDCVIGEEAQRHSRGEPNVPSSEIITTSFPPSSLRLCPFA
jgi:hypothetical protein